ncbi:hypothetical protein [Rhodovulum sulfidophilum]|uniref:Uncharacterized protein n=1 Tax=Rhodovulum sulfidophilum TaxID=35806 RepID=A0ABS1RXW9_RHOSU|nr:hypothetical protein [Rhodovulum sulfidophilum]MBL3610886.1 hypothetical protein [Rhodovulum sulfidophilum]
MIDLHLGSDTNGQRIDRDLAGHALPRLRSVIRGAVGIQIERRLPEGATFGQQSFAPYRWRCSAPPDADRSGATCRPLRPVPPGYLITAQERISLWSSMPLHSKIASATGAEGMCGKAACT